MKTISWTYPAGAVTFRNGQVVTRRSRRESSYVNASRAESVPLSDEFALALYMRQELPDQAAFFADVRHLL